MPKYKNMYPVDLANGEARRVNIGTIYQGDSYANRIGAIVTENGLPVSLGGSCHGKLVFTIDDETVPLENGIVDGNKAYCDLIPTCYDSEGPVEIHIKWTNGTETAELLFASGYLKKTETDTIVDPSGHITLSVETLINNIAAAESTIPEDYSILSNHVDALTHIDLTDNGYVNGSGAEVANSDYRRTGYIPIASDSFLVLDGFFVGSTSGSAYAYYFYTSDKTPISGANGITTKTVVSVIPQTAAYVRFSSRISNGEHPVAYVSNHVVQDFLDLKERTEVVEDDVADLKSAVNYGTHQVKIALNSISLIGYFIGASKKWSNNGHSYMSPVPNGAKSITVKANADRVTVLCMLKNDKLGTSGTSVATFSSDQTRHVVNAGETATFQIPSDCKIVNFLGDADGGLNYAPSSVVFTVEDISSQPLVGQKNDNWIASAYIYGASWSSNYAYQQGILSSTSSVNIMASGYIPIPVAEGKMLVFPVLWDTATSTILGWCIYDESGTPIHGRSAVCPASKGENDPFYVTIKAYLPKNAKYFRTTYWTDAFREGKDIPEFTYSIIDIPDEWKPITHELPVDTYMQNAIRRARQLTDIKWTPRVNIPRYSMIRGGDKHFLDWFYADHEYVGIPYSGAGDDETHWSTIKDWGYTHNWVGQHIPIEAFVTAARYPNSIMGEKASQSVVSYDASPYGDVCTALVNYVVDGPTPLRGITNFFSDNTIYRRSNVNISNTDMNTLSIGDLLYTSAHVIFISDLMRDANGNVTHIEMSEETTVGNNNNAVLGTKFGGVARRKMWDINEFKSVYGAYIRFRRTTFYGIPYVKSKYVNTGNEGDMETMVDMACIPYLGEGAIYKVGYVHNSKICIGATGFTSLVVSKDGEAFGTFDVTGLTEIEVGFSDAGSYEAYLSDGTTQTIPCHWTVEA